VESLTVAAFRGRRIWVPVALTCLFPVMATAQEVGGLYSIRHSQLRELRTTAGYGAYVGLAQRSTFNVRVSWERLSSQSSRIGRVCTLYAPLVGCAEETVQTDTNTRRLAVTGAWRVLRHSVFELEAGGGASLNALRASEETESGRWSGISVQMGEKVGFHAEARGRLRPFTDAPFVLEVAVEEQRLWLGKCPLETQRYAPFCGISGLRGVRLAVGYAFRL
jgi:hypothetical protein